MLNITSWKYPLALPNIECFLGSLCAYTSLLGEPLREIEGPFFSPETYSHLQKHEMRNQRFHTDPTGNGGREKEVPRLQAAFQQRSQGQVKVFKDENYVAKHMRHVGGRQRDVSRKIHRYVYRGTLARADGKIRREWQKPPQ